MTLQSLKSNSVEKQTVPRKVLSCLIGFLCLLILSIGFIWFIIGQPKPSEIGTLDPKGGWVKSLILSPDNEFIVVGSNSLEKLPNPAYYQGELSIWKMRDQSKWRTIDLPHYVSSLSIDGKGKLLAVAIGSKKITTGPFENDGKPRQIRVYSFPELKEVHRLENKNYLKSAILSPDGSLLAAVVEVEERGRAEVIVWSTSNWEVKYTLSDFFMSTTDVRFSPDGKLLGATDYKQGGPFNPIGARVRLHDALTGKLSKDIALEQNENPKSFEFLANDRLAVEFSQMISTWRTTGVEDGKVPLDFRQKREISYSADRKTIMISNRDLLGRPIRPGQVILWDVDAKKVLYQWDRPGYGPIAITADKKKLAVGTDKVYLFDLK